MYAACLHVVGAVHYFGLRQRETDIARKKKPGGKKGTKLSQITPRGQKHGITGAISESGGGLMCMLLACMSCVLHVSWLKIVSTILPKLANLA